MKLFNFQNIHFKETLISARDIHKNSNFFMKKEITESYDIVKKTINNHYLDQNSKKEIKIFSNKILKLIEKKKINKILFTGMGTTFTAAKVISFFFNKHLKKKYNWLEIKSVLASDGSLYEIKSDMSDTLMIVIAQSGTTRDTNIFAELCKKRKCKIITFLNKRDGDISYIAHNVFYIGDGRDVEIAVPSTKTYFGHLILGIIFLSNLLNLKIYDLKLLHKNNFYKIYSKYFFRLNFSKLFKKFSTIKNWFILSDNKLNESIASEARIKFSECCYKSTANMDLEKFKNLKISDSILTIFCESNKKNLNIILELIKNNNNIILLTNKKFNFDKKLRNKIFQINLNYKNDLELVISKILIAQLLSFHLARYLNHKSIFFKKLVSIDIKNRKKYLKTIRNFNSIFLNKILLKKLEFYILKNNSKMTQKTSLEIFNSLSRTIDTVRHQAKTITVGTNRLNTFQNKNLNKTKFYKKYRFDLKKKNQKKFIHNFKSIFKNSCNFKILHDASNFKVAIKLSEYFASKKKTAFAIDSIENHKHVDISSEPLIIVLINYDNQDDFVNDSISEFESMISHNNKIFLITDFIDKRYLKVFKKNNIYCTYNNLSNIKKIENIFN